MLLWKVFVARESGKRDAPMIVRLWYFSSVQREMENGRKERMREVPGDFLGILLSFVCPPHCYL